MCLKIQLLRTQNTQPGLFLMNFNKSSNFGRLDLADRAGHREAATLLRKGQGAGSGPRTHAGRRCPAVGCEAERGNGHVGRATEPQIPLFLGISLSFRQLLSFPPFSGYTELR